MKIRFTFFILFLICIIGFPYAYAYVNRSTGQDDSTAQDEYGFLSVAQNITNLGTFENIQDHINNLSRLGSRTTGYNGCDKAAEYIRDKFIEYKLEPLEGTENYFQKYDLMVPMDHNTTVEVLYPNGTQDVIEGYALWPNDVQACQTPPGGIEGPLIYAKNGLLSDFNGKDVNGSIVLMDFDSEGNWLNAVKLGATAAIFIEPYDTNRIEAEKKFTNTPLYFPRIFVKRSYGGNLRQLAATGTMRVRIKSDMRYETVQAENVIGVIKGINTDESIIFSSYHDSWSVVPKLNPGADEASGVAALLELARFFSKQTEKPLRNIVFAAFSGHWEALAGAREFVEKFFEAESVVNGDKKYWFLINLDFSSDSEYINYLYTGDFYHIVPGHVGTRFDPIIRNLIERKYIVSFNELSEKKLWEYDFSQRPGGFGKIDLFGSAQFPTFVLMDSEPFAAAGGVGISFRTSRCYRLNWGTPFNTVDKVKLSSLKHQLVYTFCTAYALARESSYGSDWPEVAPKRVWQAGSGAEGGGVVTVYGDVVEYDWVTGFYTNRNILQDGYQILVEEFLGWNEWYAVTRFNPFARVITTVNNLGEYTIHGLGSYFTLAQFTYARTDGPYHFLAYVINRTTSQIEYAPDLGQWGLSQYKFRDVYLKLHPQFIRTVVFKAGSIILYDLVDPGSLSPVVVCNYNTYAPQAGIWMIPVFFQVNDFYSHSWLTTFGTIYSFDTCETMAMIFVPPEQPVEIVMIYAWAGGRRILGVLANMSASSPQGTGFVVKAGEHLSLTFTALQFAEDLYWLNRQRLDLLLSYNVNSTLAVSWIKSAEAQLNAAHSALDEGNYEKAYTAALSAWSFMVSTQSDVKSTIDDTVKALIFFSAISIPFAFLAERLFVRANGKRRIVAIIGILSLLLTTLFFLHPGFRIASGSFALLLSFGALVLSLPVLAILFSDIFGFFKELRQKVMGAHFAEISRIGAVMMAFSVGIGNMWRRKLRTTLVLVTVILITVSLIALTSVSSIVIPRTQVSSRTTPDPRIKPAFYDGIVIKHLDGQADVSTGLIPLMDTLLNETVAINKRSWIFPSQPQGAATTAQAYFEVWGRSNTSFNAWVIEGMSPEEQIFTPINESLIAGRWFTNDDFDSCIISEYAAGPDVLNVSIEDRINVWGLNLTVKGIIAQDIGDNIADIDYAISKYGIKPIMQSTTVGGVLYIEVSFKYIIIVPYKFAQSILSAPTYSLSFKVPDVEKAESTAIKLVFGGAGFYDIYVGSEDTVSLHRSTVGFVLQGWQFMPIPILLGALTVLNTMIAAIYERMKDISVYSSVGLAPIHVAGMFFAESVVFAVIGGVLGYLLGSGFLVILIHTQALPSGFIPNYSSFYVIIAVLISMVATMGASLLPLFMVARQVTPSLERKWKIPTKPMENEWAIPLPFEAGEGEVMGTLAFIKEFLETHAVERAEAFVTREISYKEELDERGRPVKALMADILLPPYDAGIVQSASVNARWSEEVQRYAFELYSKQLSGLQRGWIKSNRVFANEIRKQLLLWRGLTPETREDYLQKAKQELKTVKEKKG